MKKKLLSILLAALMIVSLLPTVAFAEPEVGEFAYSAGSLEKQIEAAEDGAIITLDKDYKASTALIYGLRLETVKTVTIDLNGHTIDGNGGGLFSLQGTNITIRDTSEGQTGKLTNAKYAFSIGKSSIGRLESGTITGCVNNESALIELTKSDAGAPKFIMTGGKITGNTVSTSTVVADAGSTVVFCGGEISGNTTTATSSSYAGGFTLGELGTNAKIYLGGSFKMINNLRPNDASSDFQIFLKNGASVSLGDDETVVSGTVVPKPTDEMCVGLFKGNAQEYFGKFLEAGEEYMKCFYSCDNFNVVTYQEGSIGMIQGYTYGIGTLPTYEYGSITTNKPRYTANETVKVIAMPNEDCSLTKLTVTIGDDEPVDITDTKSFTWPNGGKTVTLAAEFVSKNSGSAEIEVTVPELNPEYNINIPAKTTLTYNSTDKQALTGSVYITGVKNFKDKQVVTCTVSGTDLANGEKTLTTTYYYGENGSTAVSTTPTFDCGTGEDNGTVIYAQVADWSGAVAGKYTATVSFQFALVEQK